MNMIAVYHMAAARTDGKVVASRMREVRRDESIVSSTTHFVLLTPDEAMEMAEVMRSGCGRFSKDDAVSAVEVRCEEHEPFLWLEESEVHQITWTLKDGEEVREEIDCRESGGDGWSWDFAQTLKDAADKAEEEQK